MRVSDNTTRSAVDEALRRTRSRMEELQMKNATQKRMLSGADDPAANTKLMDIRTQKSVNEQFESNGHMAKTRLTMTETALSEVYDIFVRAKEIAISQASDASANADSRLGVAQEVNALYKQLVAVANRRVGQQYIFGGFKTLETPYDADGNYNGDMGEIPIEIQKDVFTAANVPGPHAFEAKKYLPNEQFRNPAAVPEGRQSAVEKQQVPHLQKLSAFAELDALRTGLLTSDTETIRGSLDNLDEIIKNVVTLRAKVSSKVAGIDNAIGQTAKIDQTNAELSSQLEDADFAQVYSDLAKEETVLRSSLQSAQKLIQPTLLDFLR